MPVHKILACPVLESPVLEMVVQMEFSVILVLKMQESTTPMPLHTMNGILNSI